MIRFPTTRATVRRAFLAAVLPLVLATTGCFRGGMGGGGMGGGMNTAMGGGMGGGFPGAPGANGGSLGMPSGAAPGSAGNFGGPAAPGTGSMAGQQPLNANMAPQGAAAPTNGGAAAAGTNDPQQRQWCDRFLARVNQLRQGLGQQPLQFDESMFGQCLKRVQQMNAQGGGMDGHAGWEPQFGKEILAQDTGPESTADLYFSLGAGEGHYDTLYTPEVTRGAGAACSASSIAITDKSSMA